MIWSFEFFSDALHPAAPALSAHFSRCIIMLLILPHLMILLEPLQGPTLPGVYLFLRHQCPGQGPHSQGTQSVDQIGQTEPASGMWGQLHFLVAKYRVFLGFRTSVVSVVFVVCVGFCKDWICPTYQTDGGVNGTSNSGATEASCGPPTFSPYRSRHFKHLHACHQTWIINDPARHGSQGTARDARYSYHSFWRCFCDFGLMDTYEWLW